MASLTGRVLRRGDPGWDAARKDFCSRIDYDALQPCAVVFCQDVQDVANALRWARENNVPLRPRSGRHSYEGYSVVKDGLIIDVNEMDSVGFDREKGLVTVGTGIDMLGLYEKLWEVGVAVPGATGPSVGLAGQTLGGGFGPSSRKFGLTCDNLVDVEIVDAQGKILRANERENADLFWACRGGGGGNFGVATRFTLKVHPVAYVAVFNVTWGWDQYDAIVPAWQQWAPDVVDEMATFLRLGADRKLTLFGQFTADAAELPRAPKLLEPLLSAGFPTSFSMQVVPYIVAVRLFAGVDLLHPQWLLDVHSDQQIFKSTSALAYELFPAKALQLLKQQMEAAPTTAGEPNQPSMVQLLGGGGFPSRVPPDATAVVHRQAKFVLQYDAYWTAPHDAEKNIAWVEGVRDKLRPYTRGAYVNYVDSLIADWPREYYGANLERLVEIKQRYDPDNFFNFPQSIPTSLPGGSAARPPKG